MTSLRAQTWLILRNDLRLLWRDVKSGRTRLFSSLVLPIFLMLALQAFALLLFLTMRTPPPLRVETIVWAFIGFVMFGASINTAVTLLFERADFDLLLSSPVSPRAILLARLTAMAVAAIVTVAIFLVPMLNGAIVGLGARHAWGYLVWFLLGLLASSAGVCLTLILVRWLGPRRARTWSQVAAATFGALIYIGFQVQNSIPPELRRSVSATTERIFSHSATTFVALAGRGDWLSLFLLASTAAVAVYATTRVLSRVFVSGIQESGAVRSRGPGKRRYRFRDGLIRATFRKDLRLILRDPVLLSRVLPSVFYLVPVLFPLARIGPLGAPGVLAPFAVVIAMMLSSQLTAVAAAGEEGWDLIRLSPASTVTLRLAKIAAGMALPLALSTLVVLVIAGLGRPGLAVFSLFAAVVSTVGSCWLEVAAMRPTPRKDLIQRTAKRSRTFSPVRIVTSVIFFGLGAGAPALAAAGLWLLALLAIGGVVLGVIACFTLVEMEDIEFEATTTRSIAKYEAGEV